MKTSCIEFLELMNNNSLVYYTKKLLIRPPILSPADLHVAISIILKLLDESDSENKDREQELHIYTTISSFLTALRTVGLDHKAEYIAEAAKAVLTYSDKVVLSDNYGSKHQQLVLDIVGTGGDSQNTFNVSTSAAIVASGILGLKVCKHGGKASTSNSGAGDMILKLGCDVSKVNSKTVPNLWESNDFIFLLAPYFHNGMKLVSKIRRLLGIPTIFNVLGPLIHPVPHVNKRVLGVYSSELAPQYAKAAALVYPDSEIFVVWGHVGLDEVSPIGKTTIWHVDPLSVSDELDVFEVDPSMFGLPEHSLSQCQSEGPESNARFLREQVLSGNIHCKDGNAIYDYILLNTAVLYCLAKGSRNWLEGITQAEHSIHSGDALHSLQHFITSLNTL